MSVVSVEVLNDNFVIVVSGLRLYSPRIQRVQLAQLVPHHPDQIKTNKKKSTLRKETFISA